MSADLPVGDQCFRCGYNLHGIRDDKPCPECGLLAERSRRVSEELHDARPRWLNRIALGIRLIPLSIVIASAWPYLQGLCSQHLLDNSSARLSPLFARFVWDILPFVGFLVAGMGLLLGVLLLTTQEGHHAADRADRRRRRWLRICACVPLLSITLMWVYLMFRWELWHFFRHFDPLVPLAVLLTAGLASLPVLVFYQLRSLARRIHSPRLAEYCAIVGIGMSATVVYVAGAYLVFNLAKRLDFGTHWAARSPIATALMLLTLVASSLFVLWALYILVRFEIAFRKAAKQLRGKWEAADLADAIV